MTALAAADIAYQWRAERVDETRYPSPGRLVDIGGRRLHVIDHGGSGTPLVIETGAGTLALSWEPIIRSCVKSATSSPTTAPAKAGATQAAGVAKGRRGATNFTRFWRGQGAT